MTNAPAWTAAPLIHVGRASDVEEKGKKTDACRPRRDLAEEGGAAEVMLLRLDRNYPYDGPVVFFHAWRLKPHHSSAS